MESRGRRKAEPTHFHVRPTAFDGCSTVAFACPTALVACSISRGVPGRSHPVERAPTEVAAGLPMPPRPGQPPRFLPGRPRPEAARREDDLDGSVAQSSNPSTFTRARSARSSLKFVANGDGSQGGLLSWALKALSRRMRSRSVPRGSTQAAPAPHDIHAASRKGAPGEPQVHPLRPLELLGGGPRTTLASPWERRDGRAGPSRRSSDPKAAAGRRGEAGERTRTKPAQAAATKP